jgi:two-component system, chemotaxis family, chemotaxis protein CheY
LSGKRILIIEDELDLMEILVDVARDCFPDAEIGTANNGSDGVAKISAGTLDLLLTDMKLPGLSSNDLLNSIASLGKSGPKKVIVFSGHEDLDNLKKNCPAGLDINFVNKPCPIETLYQLIRSALG